MRESAEIWEAWTKHRKGPRMPLGEAQRREATCPRPHSMPIAYIGPEPRSQLCSDALSMQMAYVLSCSPNQSCPRESFQCHPSLHHRRWEASPPVLLLSATFGCRRRGRGAAQLESLWDCDGGKGHLRPLLGAVLTPSSCLLCVAVRLTQRVAVILSNSRWREEVRKM